MALDCLCALHGPSASVQPTRVAREPAHSVSAYELEGRWAAPAAVRQPGLAAMGRSARDPAIAIRECIAARDTYASLDSSAARPSSFCTSGSLPASPLVPLVTVENVGMLAYPLPPFQCIALLKTAGKPRNGRGKQTGQIDQSDVQLDDVLLDSIQRHVIPRVCFELGLSLSVASAASRNDVEARLSKLLVIGQGGSISPHRDSEKEQGMFGTLVVLLPSILAGGELVVQHEDRQHTIDSSDGDGWRQFSYAAFYADCTHEVRPVQVGYRVALAFSLCKLSSADDETDDDESVQREEDDEAADERAAVVAASSLVSPSASKSPLPSAALHAAASTVVRMFAAALHDLCDDESDGSIWARDKDSSGPCVLLLDQTYAGKDLSASQLEGNDRALWDLTNKAVAFAQSRAGQPSASSDSSSTSSSTSSSSSSSTSSSSSSSSSSLSSSSANPPLILPLLCRINALSQSHELIDDEEGRDGEGHNETLAVELQHIAPLQPPAASDYPCPLFASLLARCTPTFHTFNLLHAGAGNYK